MITWGVCRKEGTATVFCSQCMATFHTVKLSEAGAEADRVKNHHYCLPSKPWRPGNKEQD